MSQENVEIVKRGYEALNEFREFAANQADAFEEMSLRPEEYIDAGDRVVVSLRFGGNARHTGIPVEFFVVHVSTIRDGKLARLDMYQSKEQALEAAGLRE